MTIRTQASLLNLYADNATADISEADIRDGVDSMYNAGKQTLWIPAGAMRPTVTNGCAAHQDIELTTNQPNITVLDFDATSDEAAQFSICFPKEWNLGTVTFQLWWTSVGSDTTGIAVGLQGVAVSNDAVYDVAFGTPQLITDNLTTTSDEIYVSDEVATPITINGTPADDDICFFRVFRDVSNGNDTMTQDMRLIGIKLFYTTDAPNSI